MSTSDLHQASQLALAAYGVFPTVGAVTTGSLTVLNGDSNGFSATQAAIFAGRYAIAVPTYSDPTSLDATVFRERATGNLTLAVRGTQQRFESPSDLDDCLSILEQGMATEQIVALFNYISRIAAAPGSSVPQYSLTSSLLPPPGHSFLYYTPASGVYLSKPTYITATGELFKLLGESASKMLTIAGSSLGGHLAIGLATLFPELTDRAYAFNAPGFGPQPGVQRLFALLGASRPWSPAELSADPGSKILNVISTETGDADERFNLIAGKWGFPGHGVVVPTEDQAVSDVPDSKPFSWNHDQRQVTDSLAVHALLNTLDPSLGLAEFDSILRAAASGENRSLENIVDALEQTLGIDSVPIPAGNSNRDHLYQAIGRLVENTSYAALSGKLAIRRSSGDIEALANADFGSFLGLSLLSPMEIASAVGHEGFVESILAQAHRGLHGSWMADRQLTLAQRENGEEIFSAQWLRDRAAMLEIVALRNAHNIEKIGTAHDPLLTVRINYQDVLSNELLFVGDQLVAPQIDIRFGSDGADHFVGASPSDAFYGGSGSDTLEGGAGPDRLEGNGDTDRLLGGDGVDTLLGGAGNDVLNGGNGNDSLLGGAGDDELNGDRGDDLLRGGPGNDRYLIKADGGHDEINDSDSSGRVEVDGVGTIDGKGALKLSASSWLASDLGVLYSLTNAGASSANLHLTFAGGGTLTISNWRNGALGITLGNTAPAPPSWQYFTGDFIKKLEGTNYAFNGYNYVSAGAAPNSMDLIHGAAVSSHISGGGGNDGLAGMAAGDLIDGGDGDDLLLGGLGADTLIGGSGSDLIHGSGAGGLEMPISPSTPALVAPGPEISRGLRWVYANAGVDEYGRAKAVLLGADPSTLADDAGNLIEAGAGNDSIFAGSGDDIVYGGLDHDRIKGLGGSDVLEGDEGNDTISGDGEDMAGSIDSVSASLHGADLINGGAGNDLLTGQGGSDRLYGGTGNDTLSGDDYDQRFTPWSVHGGDHLDGGEGSDELIGDGGSDTLLGGEGHDSLFGDASTSKLAESQHGEDRLEGGTGDDYLEGGAGADTLLGGADNDMLWGDAALDAVSAGAAGADWLHGGDGRDTLIGGAAADTLYGGAGDDLLTGDGSDVPTAGHDSDILEGGSGSDTLLGDGGSDGLYGGEGDDLLRGGDGSDVLAGGGGTDWMEGGAGDDVYLIGASPLNGVGRAETILDHAGNNSISLEHMSSSTVQVAAMPHGDLQFMTPSGDALLVIGGAAHAGNVFRFADGRQFDTLGLIQDLSVTPVTLTDSQGREQAVGGRHHDLLAVTQPHATLAGGRGNDRLQGSGGNNTYLYRLGDGADTVVDTSVANGLVDPTQRNRIVFGTGISAGDLRLTNTSGVGGLRMQIGTDSNDSITLGGFDATSGSPAPIEGFRFADGSELSFAQLVSLGFEGGLGNDTLHGTALDDRLSGSFGNDLLVGGAGNDTYRWAPGDDADAIVEAFNQGSDTLEIGGMASAADLMFLQLGDDLIVRLRADSQQQVVVTGQFAGERIERLSFGDGTTWDHATIAANLANGLSAGDDVYNGSSGADQIHAGDGNDHVFGFLGDDVIDGGAGRDTLYGHDGNDTLLGDIDDDRLSGNMGDDRLDGGPGHDHLMGDSGHDTLIGGTGHDSLYGGAGDDLLIDGANMSGEDGSDTYQLTTWRSAVIREHGRGQTDIDWIILPFASSSAQLELRSSSYAFHPDNLLINTGISDPETLTIEGYFESPGINNEIDFITFTNGVTWSAADIYAMMPVNRLSDAADVAIDGFSWGDVIDAKGGNDIIFGRGGNDSIIGAAGEDTLYGDQGSDTLTGGTGADSLLGDRSYATAEDGNDRLEGDAGADTLDGSGGSDTLTGGSGDDWLLGGAGDDSYLLDLESGFDRIEDTAGVDALVIGANIGSSRIGLFSDGRDLIVTIDQTTVQARIVNHHGDAAIEQIRFADGLVWDASAIKARVSVGAANALVGTSANNTFVVDHVDDTISEGLNQGTDSATSSVNYALPINVENLTLTGYLNLQGTGNALDNLIVGNAGNNQLNGLDGYDTLRGGEGNDVYRISPFHDTVEELIGQGIDTVVSEGSYVLPDHVENLSSVARLYHTAVLAGNALSNVITLANTAGPGHFLNGAGGADTMISYAHGTIFHVDDPGDVLVGAPGHILTSLDWTLAPGWHDLALSGTADHGIGNEGPNELIGSSNPDRLEGRDGNDTLRGAMGHWSKLRAHVYDSWGPDTLVGGRGNDWYDIDWSDLAHDAVVELPGEGRDTVEVRGAERMYDLAEFPHVENLVLSGGGNSGVRGDGGANRLSGNDESNLLDGGAGNDLLQDNQSVYLPSSDHDTLLGGDGDDELQSRGGRDLIDGGPGSDTIVLGAGSLATVSFGRGSGADRVNAAPPSMSGYRTIVMGTGVRPSDLVLTRSGSDLSIGLRSSSADSLSWTGFYTDAAGYQISGSLENVIFADGFSMVAAQLSLRQGRATPDLATDSADVLLGGAGADSLSGLGGDDLIDGSDGADDLQGGRGNDTLHGGSGDDRYRFERGDGTDWLIGSDGASDVLVFGSAIAPSDVVVQFVDYPEAWEYDVLTLQLSGGMDSVRVGRQGEPLAIDAVRFSNGTVWTEAMLIDMATRINGTSGADSIVGSDRDDWIFGLAGNDTLRGGYGDDSIDGGTGADQMRGEVGDDWYVVDVSTDIVIEESGRGVDGVSSSISYTLSSNVEALRLTGTAPISGTGNSADNRIEGNAGNNLIDGGAGVDEMLGGVGNDSYRVDNLLDQVIESAGEGTDLVTSSVQHTLAPHVENLTLTGTSPLNAYGNELANLLTGNGGNNRLEGGAGDDTLDGGAGSDTMFGGTGNDQYLVGSTGDSVVESSGEGVDTIVTGLAWTLGDQVENLSLTGSAKVRGTGNALDNRLIGNSAGNELIGLAGRDTLDGGAGTDTLRGGAGDDVFHVDVTTDIVLENAGEGMDEVMSTVTWTLGNNLEHLTLTGTLATKATGNALANRLVGNAGANVLTGLAGADTLDGGGGNDTLAGGAGADTYLFRRGSGADWVQENDATSGVRDVVMLEGTLTRADLRFSRLSNDLEMSIAGTADKMVFQGWYIGSAYHAEEFRFSDSSVLTDTEAQALVGAMAAFSASSSSGDSLTLQPRMTIGTVDYTSNVAI